MFKTRRMRILLIFCALAYVDKTYGKDARSTCENLLKEPIKDLLRKDATGNSSIGAKWHEGICNMVGIPMKSHTSCGKFIRKFEPALNKLMNIEALRNASTLCAVIPLLDVIARQVTRNGNSGSQSDLTRYIHGISTTVDKTGGNKPIYAVKSAPKLTRQMINDHPNDETSQKLPSQDVTRAVDPTNQINVLFLIDGSASVNRENFKKLKMFLDSSAKYLHLTGSDGMKNTKVGLVQFSAATQTEFEYVGDSGTAGHKLKNLRQMRKRTNLNRALKYVDEKFYSKTTADGTKKQFLVIITDGYSNDGVSNIHRIHSKGVTVLAIGVGRRIKKGQLRTLAGKTGHELRMTNYAALSKRIYACNGNSCAISKVPRKSKSG